MAEEQVQTGEEAAGVTDQQTQTGANDAVVTEPQGEGVPAAGETKTEQHMIPQERLNHEIEKRKAAEEQAALLQQQMQIAQFQAQQQQAQLQKADPYGGLSDAELVDVATHKRAMAAQTQDLQQQLQAVRLEQQHPGAATTINTYLKNALGNDPTLMTQILNSPDRFMTMFLIADNQRLKTEAEQRQTGQRAAQQSAQQTAEELLENKRRILPASAAGGSAPISLGERFAGMTDAQLEAEIEKVKREGALAGR